MIFCQVRAKAEKLAIVYVMDAERPLRLDVGLLHLWRLHASHGAQVDCTVQGCVSMIRAHVH